MSASDDSRPKDTNEGLSVFSPAITPDKAALNDSQHTDIEIEPASVISYDGEAVVARVISNGCTSPNDFSIEHEFHAGDICLARLVRNRPDFCRKVPEAIELEIAWRLPTDCAEPALVRFANPVLVEPVRKLKRTLSNE